MLLTDIKDNKSELIKVKNTWKNDKFERFLCSLDTKFKDIKKDVVYDERNLIVRIEKKSNYGLKKDIAIKKFKLNRKYDQFRFRFINSKAIRSLKIALKLKKIGINTPEPIAVVEKRGRLKKIIYSYYITEYVDYDFSLLDLIHAKKNLNDDKIEPFLPQIAREVKLMHDSGVIHNDLHGGNILIKDDKEVKFFYIDLNRARIKKSISDKKRMKDLSRLKFNEKEKNIFLQNYAPKKYTELINLMKKQREKREKFRNLKKRIKKLLGIS